MPLFKENMLVIVLPHFGGNYYLRARAVCVTSAFFLRLFPVPVVKASSYFDISYFGYCGTVSAVFTK